MNKTYQESKMSKIGGRVSCIEKIFDEFELHNDKKEQTEEVSLEKSVKTTIQTFYDKGFV